MRNSKKKSKKQLLILLLAIICVLTIALICVDQKDPTNLSNSESTVLNPQTSGKDIENSTEYTEIPEESVKNLTMLEGNLKICEISSYMGSYVEDGSDEYVENIMMLILENQGDNYIQLANVTINHQYVFEFTTLFPGEKVMILEKNRSAYVENMEITSAELHNVAVFHEIPTMCEELLEIDVKDGMIHISNISENDFQGGKLFYKNVLNDQYLGGITYFSTIPKLEQGQSIKLSANHFQEDSSKLLFVTYGK